MEEMVNSCLTLADLVELLNTDDIGTYNKYGDYQSVRVMALKRVEQISSEARTKPLVEALEALIPICGVAGMQIIGKALAQEKGPQS